MNFIGFSQMPKGEEVLMTIVGENIRKLRALAGMSITDLSAASGVGRSTISEIENGKAKNPKSDTLIALSKALNTNFEQLSEMEIEHEYVITDISEALNLILDQPELHLHGEVLTDEAKLQLANSIKMALQFAEEIQKKSKK
jgi:transcriptional regulator with XRE-family HTH domain